MKTCTLILTALTTTTVCSFTAAPQSRPSLSALNLVPEQGCQLAAAWEAAATHLHDEPEEVPHLTPTAAARKFVSRIFSLPAKHHPPPQEKVGEVVYYPIVGFHYTLESCKPLPPMNPFSTSASCRIPSASETLYGWFSPACQLGHPEEDGYLSEPN